MKVPIKVYPFYIFKHRDPILGVVDSLMHQSGMTLAKIAERSKVSAGTLANWRKKKTRRPNNATIEATLGALGFERPIRRKKS